MLNKPDSLIFDMDGTLWDAVETYAKAWNEGARLENVDKVFTRADLDHVMGWERGKVLPHMLPDQTHEQRERIYETINKCRDRLIPKHGGVLYEGVHEGIKELSSQYKLFIVSNCPKGLIVAFMKWAGLTEYFIDEIAHGVNSMPKSHNIRLLIDKYELQSPVYIGDTDGDSKESRKAQVPFVFVSYGFGATEDYELKFANFPELAQYFIKL